MRVLSNVLLPFILITVIGNMLHAQSEFKKIGYIPFYKVKMVESLDFEGLPQIITLSPPIRPKGDFNFFPR